MKFSGFSLYVMGLLVVISYAHSMQPEEKPAPEQLYRIKNLSLVGQLVKNKIIPEALLRYHAKDYESFEQYLSNLPDEIKFDLIFCTIIKQGGAEIFARELQKRYAENKKNAINYFNKFCQEGQLSIIDYLMTQQSSEVTELISDLMDAQESPDKISKFAKFFDFLDIENNEPMKSFASIMAKVLTDKLYAIIQAIHNKPKLLIFDEKIKKQATALINAFPDLSLFEAGEEAEEQLEAQLAKSRAIFYALNEQQKEEALAYLIFDYGPRKKHALKVREFLLGLGELVPARDQIKYLRPIYNLFIRIFPQAPEMVRTHANVVDPITSIFDSLNYIIAQDLALKIYARINENLLAKIDPIYAAYTILATENNVLASTVLKRLLSEIRSSEDPTMLITLTNTPEADTPQVFELLLSNMFNVIIAKNFSKNESESLFNRIFETYEDLSIAKDFIQIILDTLEKLNDTPETRAFKEQILGYYWENRPIKQKPLKPKPSVEK